MADTNNKYSFLDYAGLTLFWNKVKKVIEDNELVTASALTDLDTRVDNLEKSNNIPFEKGEAENTAVLKGEYEGYSNKAISKTSIALGGASNAGLKGWYYSGIDFANNKIYLSKTQPNSINTSDFTTDTSITLDDIQGQEEGLIIKKRTQYIAGDALSIVCNSKYENKCKITAVEPGIITVDVIPFTIDNLPSYTLGIGKMPDDFTLYSVMPEVNSTTKQLTVRNWNQGGIDLGGASLAEGANTYAVNVGAHAEGLQTVAYGQYSHTEGFGNKAGYAAHAEGRETNAIGESSHTEGLRTKTIDIAGHAEGADTVAGQKAHAEGSSSEALGYAAHAEGGSSKAIGQYSHAEGKSSEATGNNSHAEGSGSKATDQAAHAEGVRTEAGYVAHAEGYETKANGKYSHSEGYRTTAFGESVHVEGVQCNASNIAGHAEGYETKSGYFPSYTKATYYKCVNKNKIWLTGNQTIPKVNETVYTDGYVAPFKVGDRVLIFKAYNENSSTKQYAYTVINVDRNVITIDSNISTPNIGESIVDNRSYSIINLTTGEGKTAIDKIFIKDVPGLEELGMYAHSEGSNTIAEGNSSHAEGKQTMASGIASHAEGSNTTTKGNYSHAEGYYTKTTKDFEHAEGSFNISNNFTGYEDCFTIHSVGIGTSDSNRKNAHEIMDDGRHYIYNIGGYDGTNPTTSHDLATYLPNMVNITHSKLKTLRDNSQLVPGQQYHITDYVTTTIQKNTRSAGHQFDIIVTADDVNVLNENARAIQHAEDTYFADSDLSAWELKYCLDNDTSRFAWADATNGKGVIYYMKDEFNNECPYDFKNIQFRHPNDTDTYPDYYYTFTWIDENRDIMDTSVFGNNGTLTCYGEIYGVYSNVIKPHITTMYDEDTGDYLGTKQTLNNIVFISDTAYDGAGNEGFYGCSNNSFGNECSYNSFGINCYRNSFGINCNNNSFGDDCSGNSFGDDCSYNSFGNGCYGNSFGNECSYNSFGTDCYNNSFGTDCSYNSFGYECYNNSFGNYCYRNSFGNYCSDNSFGDDCSDNSFGNSCSRNSFGNNCYGNSFGNNCSNNSFGNNCDYNSFGTSSNLKSYYRYIIFDNGNRYINLNCTSTTSSSKYFQNVRIGLGVNNTTTYKTIDSDNVGQAYETLYKPANSQTITI